MYEIVYTSAARRPFDPQQLGQLLEVARRNNERLSVSGILLYEAGSFMQVLEGERAVVEPLYAKISQDERHQRIHVLREGPVATPSSAAWSMGFVSLDARLMREFPKRHALSSNGTLIDESSAVLEVLDAFRSGRFRSFILG